MACNIKPAFFMSSYMQVLPHSFFPICLWAWSRKSQKQLSYLASAFIIYRGTLQSMQKEDLPPIFLRSFSVLSKSNIFEAWFPYLNRRRKFECSSFSTIAMVQCLARGTGKMVLKDACLYLVMNRKWEYLIICLWFRLLFILLVTSGMFEEHSLQWNVSHCITLQ